MTRHVEETGGARDREAGAPMTRNRFLAWSGCVAAGAVVATLGVVGVPPIVAPSFRPENETWTPVGNVDSGDPGQADLSTAGTVVSSSFSRRIADAYLPPQKQVTPVFIVCKGNDQFEILDARCTHLGCPLAWSSMSRQFLCPCHGGVFNEHGKVIDGPPPRPLDRYEWKVENGVLYVGRLQRGDA